MDWIKVKKKIHHYIKLYGLSIKYILFTVYKIIIFVFNLIYDKTIGLTTFYISNPSLILLPIEKEKKE